MGKQIEMSPPKAAQPTSRAIFGVGTACFSCHYPLVKSPNLLYTFRQERPMPRTKNKLNPVENTVYNNIRTVLVTARQKVYSAINFAMVEAYWEVGRQIEQAVGDRAEYGKGLLQDISQKLSVEFGKGFTVRNLQAMRQFYTVFPNTHALRAELSWTHFRLLMKVVPYTIFIYSAYFHIVLILILFQNKNLTHLSRDYNPYFSFFAISFLPFS